MFSCETRLRVRYGETDRMGYVYYGNYAEYIEVGRVEALRELGFSYREIEDSGVMLPVLEYHCKYFRPATYDEELTVRTLIKELPETRIRFEYEIENGDGVQIHKAETTLVFVDRESGRPCRCPEDLRKALEMAFQG